ncbi:hypothetical protein L9F63_016271, partial [Diploptera punctata]
YLLIVPYSLINKEFFNDTAKTFVACDEGLEDYNENSLERLVQYPAQKRSSLIYLFRRACVRRGGNCDHRPKDCCYNSSCRCNLWGANCRCQRMGLFQKWGK